MIKFKKCTTVICLIMSFFSCGKKAQDIPYYTVSKVFKTDSVTTVNVHINNRVKSDQLLIIAGKLKTDSAQIQNLEVHFLLPGNAEITSGDNSYYASARFVKENEVKPADTLKDYNGNVLRIKIFGLSNGQAKHLLTLQPTEIQGKKVIGRFIDDYNHTVIIPFEDTATKKNDLYVIELDSTSKIVSATMPLKVNDGGVEKWMVTQNGDYITIKNNILSQYTGDGMGLPFNSIKSGI